jgi:hypothetical protein
MTSVCLFPFAPQTIHPLALSRARLKPPKSSELSSRVERTGCRGADDDVLKQLKGVRDPIFHDSDFVEFWHSPEFKSQRGPFQSSLDSLEACEDIASLNRNDLGIDLPPAVFEEIYNAELGLDL